MAIIIGQELGSYRIISQIGKGGMATVYKAFQPSLDRYVAIKIMPPFYAQQDDTFLKRFRREARAVGKLRHPNILIVIDYGEHDDVTYIVMEYVDAGTLTDRLGTPMPLHEIGVILEQISSALDYAHGQGVIHRDVKPSNILLPKPDWPLLTDFGLAKIVGGSQLTLTGSIAGTPAYMSPEQGQGENVDARSDIYSLGIVLYEMATGVVPFYAETPMAIVVKHIIDPLPLPTSKNPNLSTDVERVILKALAKNRSDRYQRVSDLSAAFNAAIGETHLAGKSDTILEDSIASEPAPVSIDLPRDFSARSPAAGTEINPNTTTTAAQAAVEPAFDSGKSPPPTRSNPFQKFPKWLIPAALVGGLLCMVGFAGLALVGLLSRAISAPEEVVSTLAEIPTEESTPAFTAIPELDVDPTLTAFQIAVVGRNLANEGDYEGAIREYETAIEAGSKDELVYLDLANAYIVVGRGEEAQQPLAAVIELAPDEAWVAESAAWYYQELGLHEEAISNFERALVLDPESIWLYGALADSYIALGDFEKADEILGIAFEVGDQEDPSYYESLGWSYFDSGNYNAAESAFNQAIIIDPTYVAAWDGLSDLHWSLGNYDLALLTLDEALVSNPNESTFHEKKGWIYKEIGIFEDAEESFNAAINLDPIWSTAYDALAQFYAEDGDFDRAISVLESGLEANPSRDDLYESLGFAYMDQYQLTESILAFQKAIEIYPEYGWYYWELAIAYRLADQYDDAIAALETAETFAEYDPWLKDGIGWEYVDLGHCDIAMEFFEDALRMEPTLGSSEEGIKQCGG